MSVLHYFRQLANWFSDPLFLLRSNGSIVACNLAATGQLRIQLDSLAGESINFLDLVVERVEGIRHFLFACSRVSGPIPDSVVLPDETNQPVMWRCAGGSLREDPPGDDKWVLLRLTRHDATPTQFKILNDQIAELQREIKRRQKAEEEHRALMARIQQAQKLESLGVLAGGIAHDFNNLLTTILGYTDLALYELPGHSPARPLIIEAVNGARRAAELTQQMLAYSGKGKFVVEPINLSRITEEMMRLLEISISKKCVMRFELTPNLPTIEADPSQIRQIIMNLIINASEAIGERSGVIMISTGVMDCDSAYLTESYLDENLQEGLYVYLEVTDNGCGMSDETRTRIFDPFFTTKFTGRGLGLSAVMGIVRGHRGAIRCYSELGKGTTFKVLLPASELPEQIKNNPARLQTWTGKGLVLVVDDEETIRGLARHQLRKLGFTVLTAADGREALDLFRREADQLELVLLDMTMPHMDGAECFREMRRIRSKIKVILCSGYNEQTATNAFLGKGLAGFLQKPYSFEDLTNAIRKALESNTENQTNIA